MIAPAAFFPLLTLMFQDSSVVTAHADFTSGSHSLYVDNPVTVEIADSLGKRAGFSVP